ncbi:MAG: response regulator, partial [Proteobacteria bacterium]|nr:response regulator [Pseudomonadota bacterium]
MAAPVKPKLSLSMVKNAVIIDGDNSMLSLVGNYLTKASVGGLQKFNSGEEAFKYIEQNPVDLVILDWKMKNPTGLALYEKIRAMENAIQLPIVLISGVVTANDVQIAQVDKFAKFIVKPFAEEVFLSSISKFVGKPSTAQTKNSQTNSGSEPGKAASAGQNQTMTNSQGKPSDMQIVRNGSNVKDDQGGLVIVAGGKANGLGLQVDKGQRISGNGTEIFDQDGPGPAMNARQSGPGQGDEFSAVQKRDAGSDMEIRQSRAGNGSEIDAKQEGHAGQGFSMNQEGSGPGSSMNGSFAKDGIGGPGFDVNVEGPKTDNNFDGKFQAQKPGAANDGEFEKLKAGNSANASMPSNQSGMGFNVNAQNQGLPTGQDFLDPQNNSGSGGDASQSNGSGNGFNVNQNGAGSVGDISGTQQSSPANGQDYQFSGTESGNNASDGMNQDADRVIPKPAGFALDDGADAKPERVKKSLCKAVVMGSQVEVFVPLDVLVVDHDEAQQKLIAQHLTEIGAEKVQCLSESPTAWDRIQTEPFDLIIIDWKLKGLSGLALYSRIRERAETASTPVIVISMARTRSRWSLVSSLRAR